MDLIPGSERSPEGGHGNPLQYSCLAHQAPPVPGILQARTLEWVAISFSNA